MIKHTIIMSLSALSMTSAATVSVNVSSQTNASGTVLAGTGAGILGSGVGDTWNAVSGDGLVVGTGTLTATNKTVSTIVDINNVATSHMITFNEFRLHGGGSAANSLTGIGPWQNAWFADHRTMNNDQSGIVIGGFDAGDIVDIVIFNNFHRSGVLRGQTYSINGSTMQSTTGQNTTPTAFTEGVNYLQFTGIPVNGANEIVVSVDAPAGSFTDFAGLQFDVVPEPSSALLCGFGLLGFLRRHR